MLRSEVRDGDYCGMMDRVKSGEVGRGEENNICTGRGCVALEYNVMQWPDSSQRASVMNPIIRFVSFPMRP